MTMETRRARLMTGEPARIKGQRKPRDRRVLKKTKICPVCSQAFMASRSDQVYCTPLHRWYANSNSIPQAILDQAAEARRKRTEAAAQRRETLRATRAKQERDTLRKMIRHTECDGSCFAYATEIGQYGGKVSPMSHEVQRLKAEAKYCG